MVEEVINCQRCGVPAWNNKNGTRKYCPDCQRIIKNERREDYHRIENKALFGTYRRMK